MDKRYIIHVVAEVVVIIGVVVFFLKRTANLLNSIQELERTVRAMATKISELEAGLDRLGKVEKALAHVQALVSVQTFLPVPPVRAFAFSHPPARESGGAKITTLDEQLGISDDDFVEVSNTGQSDLDELVDELAELDLAPA
jgi:hypothetical protein